MALGVFDDHVVYLDVTRSRFVESGANNLPLHASLHIGYFLCSLADEQDEKIDLRMLIRARLGHVLKKDGFTRTGRRNAQRALALPLRRNNINDARRLVLHRGIMGIEA